MAAVYQTLVTTLAFNQGRLAAKRDMLHVRGPVTRNDRILNLMGSEFAAGYKFELAEFDVLPKDIQANVLAHWEKSGI